MERERVDAKTTDNTCTCTQASHAQTTTANLLAYSQTLERYHPLHHCGLLVGEWA